MSVEAPMDSALPMEGTMEGTDQSSTETTDNSGTEVEETREFPNSYPDYESCNKSLYNSATGKLNTDIEEPLIEAITQLLETLEKRLPSEINWNDPSVYTGVSGISLLYMHLMDVKELTAKKDFPKLALQYIEPLLNQLKKKRFSFLCGVSGILAVAAVLFNKTEIDMAVEGRDWAQRMENLENDVHIGTGDMSDELLYGRVGFLYSLMYIQKNLGKHVIADCIIEKIVGTVISEGKYWSKRFRNTLQIPLYYEWHSKAYIGAAHGFAGILFMLLQAKEYIETKDVDEFLKPSIELLLSIQFPNGNFPSSVGNNSDRLVHWCHGAPGVIHLLLLAYLEFGEENYLESAKRCSDIIWERGLLKKGYGLCHGVAGNGYAHLRVFQVTKDEKYLYRALKFGEWCYDYGKHGCRNPDRPLSLFEGLAGTIYFLSDLVNPLEAKFPGFQL